MMGMTAKVQGRSARRRGHSRSSARDAFRDSLPQVVLLVCTLALAGCSGDGTNGSGIAIDYERYELANGLEVILHVDRSDPIAAVAMTFHVGSAREVTGKTGFAHLFEHLFFLDSENLGPGGLDRLMTRVGSSTNGSTSKSTGSRRHCGRRRTSSASSSTRCRSQSSRRKNRSSRTRSGNRSTTSRMDTTTTSSIRRCIRRDTRTSGR